MQAPQGWREFGLVEEVRGQRQERVVRDGMGGRSGQRERWGHGSQGFKPGIGVHSECNMKVSWSRGLAEEGRSTKTALDEVGRINCRGQKAWEVVLQQSWVRGSGL